MKTTFTLALLLVSLTSCSYLTKTGRQEHAYRSYIRKSSVVRVKQQKKFHFRVPQMAIRQDSPRHHDRSRVSAVRDVLGIGGIYIFGFGAIIAGRRNIA